MSRKAILLFLAESASTSSSSSFFLKDKEINLLFDLMNHHHLHKKNKFRIFRHWISQGFFLSPISNYYYWQVTFAQVFSHWTLVHCLHWYWKIKKKNKNIIEQLFLRSIYIQIIFGLFFSLLMFKVIVRCCYI